MKLYELPKNTKFTIMGDEEQIVFLFHHIDGMYSYCTRDFNDELDQTPIHITAWTEVEIVVSKEIP